MTFGPRLAGAELERAWASLTHALSGLFCASLNALGPAAAAVRAPPALLQTGRGGCLGPGRLGGDGGRQDGGGWRDGGGGTGPDAGGGGDEGDDR